MGVRIDDGVVPPVDVASLWCRGYEPADGYGVGSVDAQAGVAPSVGSVGDAYDNALAAVADGRGCRARTMYYVHWFNHDRLMEITGDIPPIELEQAHYARKAGDD